MLKLILVILSILIGLLSSLFTNSDNLLQHEWPNDVVIDERITADTAIGAEQEWEQDNGSTVEEVDETLADVEPMEEIEAIIEPDPVDEPSIEVRTEVSGAVQLPVIAAD